MFLGKALHSDPLHVAFFCLPGVFVAFEALALLIPTSSLQAISGISSTIITIRSNTMTTGPFEFKGFHNYYPTSGSMRRRRAGVPKRKDTFEKAPMFGSALQSSTKTTPIEGLTLAAVDASSPNASAAGSAPSYDTWGETRV